MALISDLVGSNPILDSNNLFKDQFAISRMTESIPQFASLSKIEEVSLLARLDAIRKIINHAGEKGRSLETEVCNLLKTFLPSEYGLSTGFIAYHSSEGVKLSPQLDIVIYDSLRCGPIARLGSCDVFPLEAVYGYVEVKASLQSTSDQAAKYAENSIETCILSNKTIRNMIRRHYYSRSSENVVVAVKETTLWTPLRAYIFAFEPIGEIASNPPKMAKRVSEFSKQTKDVHMHGIFIGGSAYYSTIAVDPSSAKPEDFYHVKFVKDGILSAFKWSLIHDLSRFPRHPDHWTPALDKYNETKQHWEIYPTESRTEGIKDVYDY